MKKFLELRRFGQKDVESPQVLLVRIIGLLVLRFVVIFERIALGLGKIFTFFRLTSFWK
jgi:hypothetical protein